MERRQCLMMDITRGLFGLYGFHMQGQGGMGVDVYVRVFCVDRYCDLFIIHGPAISNVLEPNETDLTRISEGASRKVTRNVLSESFSARRSDPMKRFLLYVD